MPVPTGPTEKPGSFLSSFLVAQSLPLWTQKNHTKPCPCSTIKSGKWRMWFNKRNITVKDTHIAHQAILGLDKKPNPQFQGQKPETLSTPCTRRHLQQLPAPTPSHCRNATALLLCDVSVAWCAWRTATASSILQKAQGGEEVELLQQRSTLHKIRNIPGPDLASVQTHFQEVKDFNNNNNYKIQVCCFCRRLISSQTSSVSSLGKCWGISPFL